METMGSSLAMKHQEDTYANFAALNAMEREGVDFYVHVIQREASSTLILAPHGGGIEPGTSEVAKLIAGDNLSCATFEGRKRTGNSRLHVTSTNFDEPRCLALVLAADNVLTIHGEQSEKAVVFLGGRDTTLGKYVRTALEDANYIVEAHKDQNLQGMDLANICNRGRKRAGVQLELSLGLRTLFFASLNAEGRTKPTDELIKFASAVRKVLHDGRPR